MYYLCRFFFAVDAQYAECWSSQTNIRVTSTMKHILMECRNTGYMGYLLSLSVGMHFYVNTARVVSNQVSL